LTGWPLGCVDRGEWGAGGGIGSSIDEPITASPRHGSGPTASRAIVGSLLLAQGAELPMMGDVSRDGVNSTVALGARSRELIDRVMRRFAFGETLQFHADGWPGDP